MCKTTMHDVHVSTASSVPQQGDVLHAAPDRGAVFTWRSRRSHRASVLDHQSQEATGLSVRIHMHAPRHGHALLGF